ncbi:MAG: hypothetical protein ACP5OO_08155 [Chloroflexia bacterium]
MARRWLTVAFLLMGVSFTILQALMVRELLVSFSGNELAIGLVLGAWLLLEALGSGLAGRIEGRLPAHPAGYALLQAALALLLFPTLLLAVHVRGLLGAVPGEVVAPPAALWTSLLALAPVGLVDGAMFATACRVYAAAAGTGRGDIRPAGRVYVLEALGSILGGLLFTFLLIPSLSSTQVLLLVAGLNLLSAATLLLSSLPRRLPAGLAAGVSGLAALGLFLSPLAPDLHRAIIAGRWSPFALAYEGNSPYGNIAVIAQEGQITLFVSGSPLLTAPDPDLATVEQLVHLPALFLDEMPRRALVIGGGAGGVLHELQRYPLEALDYAEPDPFLIQALRAVPVALTEEELGDPRLHLALEDGRRFIAGQAGRPARYDLIVLNLPVPATLELNRLYTREFLEMVRPLLAPRGVLVLPAPPARTYLSPAARDLLACYARTLKAVFPFVRPIPADEQTLFLASAENALEEPLPGIIRRWEERGLETRVLNRDYLRYLLDEAVAEEFAAGLSRGPEVEVNRDGHPAGLRYALGYESARYAPALEPFFRALGALRPWHVAVGIAVLTLPGLFFLRRRERLVPWAIATTGLAGMTADLLILLTFQVLYGYLYQQVGLLVTAFMAGLSLGGQAMTAGAGRLRRPWRMLTRLEGGVALLWAGLGGGLYLLLRRPTPSSALEHLLLLAMNLLAGLLVGAEFPLAGRILMESGRSGSRVAGALYAWDLVGATVGAVAVSAVMIPALGLVETALLTALGKAGTFLLAVVARPDSAQDPRR